MDTTATMLGRYSLKRVCAGLASGVVYEAFDIKLNRRVAIKTIDTNQFDVAPQGYQNEAKAAARLNHPNIAQVYDYGEELGVVYLVMEFIDADNLKELFDKGQKFELGWAVRVMRALLDALQCAHDAHVVHRDVKPANVHVTKDGHVKLADFGVALIDGQGFGDSGEMVGTPAYMSPEQATGAAVDRRTDLFSAGIVLYMLLTSQKPFTGTSVREILKQIVQYDPAPPSTTIATLPRRFDEVVKKALAKDPDMRFASAREFSDALQTALDSATQPIAPADRLAPALEPCVGDEPFIFASYKREDFARIEPVLSQIAASGYRVWYDKGIPGSAEWASLLEDRLKACSLMIFFMSRGSVESKYCRREINYIDSLDKPILCVRLEEAKLQHGLDMLLTQYQMVDATTKDFAGEIERALKYLRLL